MKTYWVYILECSDKTYYTGVTSDIEGRLYKHQTAYYPKAYTATRRPVKLLWYEEFKDIRVAIEFEKQLKGWSRKKKQALMKSDFDALHFLAQSEEMIKRREARKEHQKLTDSSR